MTSKYSAAELAAGKAATLALVGPQAELISPYPFKLPEDKQRAPEGSLNEEEVRRQTWGARLYC